MTSGRRNNELSHRGDALDSMFTWAERAFCPAGMKNYKPEPKEDTLDYVFEHVESFTCQQEDEKEPDVMYTDHGIQRDNSLLEADSYGQPIRVETQRQHKPLGQQGDLVDYVFEHVESYVCNEDIPADAAVHRSMAATVTPPREPNVTYRAVKARVEKVYEPEEEIQLYFRPRRDRWRRNKKGKRVMDV